MEKLIRRLWIAHLYAKQKRDVTKYILEAKVRKTFFCLGIEQTFN